MTIYQDTDIITDDMARELMGRGACSYALNYVGRTVGEAAKEAPWAALRYAAEFLTAERLDACAVKAPLTALEYAAEYLTPERIDDCAAKEPWAALEYAAEYLTPERIDDCAAKEPWRALRYAAKYLTAERLDACEKEIEKKTKHKQVFPELLDQGEIDGCDNDSGGWWIVPGLAVGLIAWCLIIRWIVGVFQAL